MSKNSKVERQTDSQQHSQQESQGKTAQDIQEWTLIPEHLDPYSELLGMEALEVGPGRAVVRMTVRANMINPHGTAHGGSIFSLADTALALASNSHGIEAVALNVNLTYCRPGLADTCLTAVVTEENLTRSTGMYKIEVQREDGKLVASGQGNVFRTGRPFRGW